MDNGTEKMKINKGKWIRFIKDAEGGEMQDLTPTEHKAHVMRQRERNILWYYDKCEGCAHLQYILARPKCEIDKEFLWRRIYGCGWKS